MLGCRLVGAEQQVAFQRIVRRIRILERPRHRKPGIQASGEFGRDKFFRLAVFRTFLHGAPPAGFFIVEVRFGIKGVLGRKNAEMGVSVRESTS
ncbi:hypothetical protein MAFF211471_24060 [Ralstonia solanacearum]|nr:hypothetical protein MAFF211471_24060 [Ralstonia solanacearum]BCM99875.1 hypothetical protein RPSA_24120 [Ralstonia solanacearum]